MLSSRFSRILARHSTRVRRTRHEFLLSPPRGKDHPDWTATLIFSRIPDMTAAPVFPVAKQRNPRLCASTRVLGCGISFADIPERLTYVHTPTVWRHRLPATASLVDHIRGSKTRQYLVEHNFPQARNMEEKILCVGVVNNKCVYSTVINKCSDHFREQHRE